ncbi:MAG: histidinol-phosphatase [Flavobacteriaceae bacterium]
MIRIKIALLLLITVVIGCKQNASSTETEKNKTWFKGNLHTHSYWSDGDEFPEVILDWYKKRNYQFMALSDHNTISEGDKWITIREDSLYQNAFQDYLDTYGSNWVESKTDSGRTLVKLKTFQEYRNKIEEKGKFLIIHSEEITDDFEGNPIHMNATNIQKLIEPQGGNSVVEVMQNNLDAVRKQREETGIPTILHLNHPNYYFGVSTDDIIALNGERFFEVYNGHPAVRNTGDSTHLSTEKMWDLINIAYVENKKPLLYGLATDDSHEYHTKGSKWSNAGRGWVMVQADTLSAAALILSLEAGDFYSSTGVVLKKVAHFKNTLSIEVAQEAGVSYEIKFIGCKKGELETEELLSVTGTKADFKLTDDVIFVRCKIISSKLQDNPIENILYEMAWTQPILGIDTP